MGSHRSQSQNEEPRPSLRLHTAASALAPVPTCRRGYVKHPPRGSAEAWTLRAVGSLLARAVLPAAGGCKVLAETGACPDCRILCVCVTGFWELFFCCFVLWVFFFFSNKPISQDKQKLISWRQLTVFKNRLLPVTFPFPPSWSCSKLNSLRCYLRNGAAKGQRLRASGGWMGT